MAENSDDDDYKFSLRLHKRLNGETDAERSKEDEDADLQFAKSLQAELNDNDSDLDRSLQFVYPGSQQQPPAKIKPKQNEAFKSALASPGRPIANDYLNQTQHLVHPEWELIDPSPDVHAMFVRFNAKFFQNRLGAVVLEWSKRMYSCAGICYQRSNRYTKEVIIRLSEPLLKLRPRKDLVETLLHEMIHAYFFILNVREGNGGHGPNFKAKMNMINRVAGTNITVYHTFHDEVNAYRTHIWRCTGICQNHAPFLGYVKRTSNRAPGPNDQWWEKHQRECGGTFMKISEPPKPPAKEVVKVKKPSKKAAALPVVADSQNDIRQWFKKPPAKKPATADAASLNNLQGTEPPKALPGANPKPFTMPRSGGPPKSWSTGNNIKSFADLPRDDSDDEEPPKKQSRHTVPTFTDSDQGYTMPTAASGEVNDIREIREKRFGRTSGPQQKLPTKGRQNEALNRESWESYGDDVMVRDAPKVVIDLAADSGTDDDQETQAAPKKNKKDKRKKPKKDSVPPKGFTGSFNESGEVTCIDNLEVSNESDARKRRRNSSDTKIEHWEAIDHDVIEINLADDTDSDGGEQVEPAEQEFKPTIRIPMSSQERSENIKREVMEDESNEYLEDEIVFIDGEYNDDEAPEADSIGLANHPEDIEGAKTLLSEFRRQNDVVPSCSSRGNDVENDIVSCPICFDNLRRSELSNHLDGCSITVRVQPPSFKRNGGNGNPSLGSKRTSSKQMLRNLGYTNQEVAVLDLSTSSDSSAQATEDELTPRQRRQRSLFKQTVGCPKCGQELMGHQLEAHRRLCPDKKRK